MRREIVALLLFTAVWIAIALAALSEWVDPMPVQPQTWAPAEVR